MAMYQVPTSYGTIRTDRMSWSILKFTKYLVAGGVILNADENFQ